MKLYLNTQNKCLKLPGGLFDKMIIETEIIKLKNCMWCGEEFIKKHNRQMYCSPEHSKEALLEQKRIYRSKYYYRKKDSRITLGTGNLSVNIKDNPEDERKIIQREMSRIGIKTLSNF